MATRKIKNRPEDALHIAVAGYLRIALPDGAVFLHVPNGGARSKAEAGKFKAMGVSAGVPDILILDHGRLHGIELKAPGRSPSEAQRGWRDTFRDQGLPWALCRSLDEVASVCERWFPMKAKLSA